MHTFGGFAAGAAMFAAAFGLLGTGRASAQQLPKQCATAEVRSLAITTTHMEYLYQLLVTYPKLTGHIRGAANRIEDLYYVLPTTLLETPTSMSIEPRTVGDYLPEWFFALGPVADVSSYARNVSAQVSCTGTGVLITATLTFFTDGISLRPDRWRPEMEIVVFPNQAEVTVGLKWQVRLARLFESSKEVKSKDEFPELKKYPITVTKTVKSIWAH